MGLFETMFGMSEPKTYDFQGMANYRLAHGFEPIDWKTILLNQLRAEQAGRQCEAGRNGGKHGYFKVIK